MVLWRSLMDFLSLLPAESPPPPRSKEREIQDRHPKASFGGIIGRAKNGEVGITRAMLCIVDSIIQVQDEPYCGRREATFLSKGKWR